MKTFIIGGTGLIGYHASLELIKKDYEIKSIGLTPLSPESAFAKRVNYTQANIEQLTDRELIEMMKGSQWLLYASSLSANTIVKAPAVEYYKVHNIYTTERILRLAQNAGIKKVVLLSNYYEHFTVEWPSMRLEKHHPYIKATYEQEISAKRFNATNFQVIVLQLPIVFGVMPKRRPVDYDNIVKLYKTHEFDCFKGGTAVMTVNQVATAIVGAFEKGIGGQNYALCGENLSYKTINEIMMKTMGINGKVRYLSNFVEKIKAKHEIKALAQRGLEKGINPEKIIDFKNKNAFLDCKDSTLLGIKKDNIVEQIQLTVKRSLNIAKQKGEI